MIFLALVLKLLWLQGCEGLVSVAYIHMYICEPFRENRPLLIFYQNAVEACKVSRVKNGVRHQIFFSV